MPKLPARVFFICDDCRSELTRRQVQHSGGSCSCGCENWTLAAVYAETVRKRGFDALLAFADWVFTRRTIAEAYGVSNQVEVGGVDRQTVLTLTESNWRLTERVSQFIQQANEQELRDRGGCRCCSCDAIFVPSEHKPWTSHGFCSKLCALQAETGTEQQGDEVIFRDTDPTGDSCLTVNCNCGASFEVMPTFVGCLRSCPECGQKCMVPRP